MRIRNAGCADEDLHIVISVALASCIRVVLSAAFVPPPQRTVVADSNQDFPVPKVRNITLDREQIFFRYTTSRIISSTPFSILAYDDPHYFFR
jgi:hypothetical protein